MDQQKILGYFIEEAKEHLETLEQGMVNLSSTVTDSEKINEMFRAAHSIKGGAAMLGYSSIQKTAHHLEDALKIFREQTIAVDQKLESLFLKAYDVLHDLVDKLQGPSGLQEEDAQEIIQQGEPIFVDLQNYLNEVLSGSGQPAAETPVAAPPASLSNQVKDILRQMLQLFKQQATPENRQKLQKFCAKLADMAPQEAGWQTLAKLSANAIANPKHSYRTLAPIVIKELKQASDLIELGNGNQLKPSRELEQLATSQLPQVLITLEPKSVAATLLKMFNKQQLSQLVQFLESGV